MKQKIFAIEFLPAYHPCKAARLQLTRIWHGILHQKFQLKCKN